jgi:hypothetical protein
VLIFPKSVTHFFALPQQKCLFPETGKTISYQPVIGGCLLQMSKTKAPVETGAVTKTNCL